MGQKWGQKCSFHIDAVAIYPKGSLILPIKDQPFDFSFGELGDQPFNFQPQIVKQCPRYACNRVCM